MVIWSEFETAEPDFAATVGARFRTHPHHLLATLRRDGSPRLSGITVSFREGHLWFGSAPGSLKASDLVRDPRLSLHSAPLSETLDGGDARVDGRARRLDPGSTRGWWPDDLAGEAFSVEVSRVHMVEVDGRELKITVWEPGRPLRIVRRA